MQGVVQNMGMAVLGFGGLPSGSLEFDLSGLTNSEMSVDQAALDNMSAEQAAVDEMSAEQLSAEQTVNPPCGVNSFTANTVVDTSQGEKPISSIKVGDTVLAYNKKTNKTSWYPVDATINHDDKIVVNLVIASEKIATTLEHPFYTEEKGWVDAGKLQTGMHIRRADGTYGEVKSVTTVNSPHEMYNLTVRTAHTLFVGQGQWLVHNDCVSENDLEIARQLQARLGNTGRGNTTFALSEDGTISASSLYKAQAGAIGPQYPAVLKLANEMNYEFPETFKDVPGYPGSYYANHAEAQLAIAAPGQIQAVSNAMCGESCIPFYQALAQYRNTAQIIADPYYIRVFNPDGTIQLFSLK